MVQIIDQHPLYLFSKDRMPYAEKTAQNKQLHWFATDTKQQHKKVAHPFFGAEDIVYSFNSHGYRCQEFGLNESDKNKLSVVSIGASEVFGVGIPENKTFPYLVTKLLEKELDRPVINWNLGLSGSSSDYISRTLFSALAVLKPSIVLLVFPFPRRREHICDLSRLHLYVNPKAGRTFLDKVKSYLGNPEKIKQIKAHTALSSEYSDHINLFKNYQVCEALCAQYSVMWCFSSFRIASFSQVEHLIDTDHLVTPGLDDLRYKYNDNPAIGWARDMGHPGIKPNQEMAELFLERLKSLYSTPLKSI